MGRYQLHLEIPITWMVMEMAGRVSNSLHSRGSLHVHLYRRSAILVAVLSLYGEWEQAEALRALRSLPIPHSHSLQELSYS